jgi:histidine triad (HIT) family protein
VTLFEKICRREIPADIVWETDRALAFRDIHPQAPVHVLVVPKRVITGVSHAMAGDADLLGHLLWVAAEVARKEGIAGTGYRLVINDGTDGGQSVDHLHVHVLGGRALAWPPG